MLLLWPGLGTIPCSVSVLTMVGDSMRILLDAIQFMVVSTSQGSRSRAVIILLHIVFIVKITFAIFDNSFIFAGYS